MVLIRPVHTHARTPQVASDMYDFLQQFLHAHKE
jgi:hypothetical protein